MTTVLLVIHLLLALALVGVVLLQRSEGGGLGIGGGGGGGMGSFMSGRATADLLTRTTAILAACFMASSLLLAYMASGGREDPSAAVLEQLDESNAPQSMPAAVPGDDLPTGPLEGSAEPAAPSVPVDR